MKHISSFALRIILILVLVLSLFVSASLAESYEASTMRLLRHEGTVEIFDVAGVARFLMDNVRFMSGESMRTGGDGQASVSLDDTKIVTLDKDTWVEFIQEAGHMQLNLMQGSLFLDVQKKLDENESFDIQTTTMTVGIRGTMIIASEEPATGSDPAKTTIAIMEGGGRFSFTDTSGAKRVVDVSAGNKIVIPKDQSQGEGAQPIVSEMTSADVPPYVADQVLSDEVLTTRVVNGSANGRQILYAPPEDQSDEKEEYFPADGDWEWTGRVTLIAQSASKLYDGKPLMRPSDALVYGLPGNFNIQVSSSGSITNVGSCDNVISSFSIYNSSGQNVTGHFKNIEQIPGNLVVDPAPLIVWTGSAEKIYDGEPLTCEDAGIRTVPGHTAEDPAWKNSSLVTQTALGSEKMIALSGSTYVHGTNPLTGQSQQLELKAGQSLSVCLHDGDDGQSLEFQIVNLREDELPEEVLRIYADNPDLLADACAQANWNPDLMAALIAALPPAEEKTAVSDTGLAVSDQAQENLMTDSTNVRIHIDSQITNYSTRALTEEEASFTPIVVDPSIVVTATGSQTAVGESYNTYTIDWGNADPKNYVIREDLGLLVVTPQLDAKISIAAGSAEKVYDGKPLTCDKVAVSGLPAGYSVRATVEGTITDAGTATNEITAYTIRNQEGEDVTNQFANIAVRAGRLTVEPLAMQIHCGGDTVAYNGKAFDPKPFLVYMNGPHTGETVPGQRGGVTGSAVTRNALGFLAATGTAPRRSEEETPLALRYGFRLFTGDTVELTLTGMGTDAGSYTLSGSIKSSFTTQADIDLKLTGAELTIAPAEVTIVSGSAYKVYDGLPLTCEDISVSGMPEGQSLTVTPTGTLTDAGTAKNTFTIGWGSLNPDNYDVTETAGTLTVTPAAVTIASGSAEKTYDGSPLTCGNVTVAGLPEGQSLTVTPTGTLTDAGTAKNTFTIGWGSLNPDNYDVTETVGTLTVTPAAVTIASGSAEKTYDGSPLTCGNVTVTGLPEGQSLTVTPTGSITDVGTADNIFTVDWGDLNPENYTVTKTYGILTVTAQEVVPFEVTIASGSAEKVYDGTPLTNSTVTVTGLPEGQSVTVTPTGAVTDVGTAENTFTVDWGDLNPEDYTVTNVYGTLTVTPAELAVASGSAEKVYDGKPLSCEEVTVTGLPADQSLIVTPAGTLTDVGTAENTFAIDWGDLNPENYTLTETVGKLTVTPAALTVTSGSAGKVFDNTPLTCEKVTVSGLPEGQSLTVTPTGTITDPGTVENTFTIDWGTLNPDNYTVTKVFGTLTVTEPGTVTITSASAEKMYDGTPLTCEEVTVIGLPEDQSVTVTPTGTVTDAGTAENTFTVDWGDLNPDNYTVTEVYGTLTVTKRAVTLTSASGSKAYDGSPLTDGTVTVGGDGFASGEGAAYSFTGTQTEVGSSENAFTYTLNENTAAGNYEIAEPVFGTLEVTPGSMTVTAVDYSGVYDGQAHAGGATPSVTEGTTIQYSIDGGVTWSDTVPSIQNAGTVSYKVKAPNPNYSDATADGTLTVTPAALTIASGSAEKVYDGTSLMCETVTITGLPEDQSISVIPTGTVTDVGTAENTFTVDWGDLNPDNYTVTTTTGTLTVTKRSVTLTSASDSKGYDGSPLTNEIVIVGGDGFADGEGVSCSFTGSQTEVGSSENAFTYTLNEGTSAGNYEIAEPVFGTLEVTLGTMTVTAVDYNGVYDAASHAGGATPSITDGTTIQFSTDDGSTWTDTVPSIQDAGTVNYKVKATNPKYNDATADGTLTVIPMPLHFDLDGQTVKPDLDYALYPTLAEGTIDNDPEYFDDGTGMIIPFTITGTGDKLNLTISNLPNYDTKVGTYQIKTALSYTQGNKDNYDPVFTNNMITLDPFYITVETRDDTKVYSGDPGPSVTDPIPASWEEDIYYDIFVYPVGASSADVGEYKNDYTVDWGDAETWKEDGKIVISEENLGTFTITPRSVTLTSESDSKLYDGTPLTNHNVSVGGDGFIDGEGASYTFTGSQTEVGTSENTFSYTLNEGTLASNYSIADPVFGTLEVKQLTVTPVSPDTWEYDGESHSGGATVNVTEGTTILYSTDEGSTWSSTPPAIKDAGTVDYKIKASNPKCDDVIVDASITVTPAPIYISTEGYSDKKVFNHEPFFLDDETIHDVEGHPEIHYTISYSYLVRPSVEYIQVDIDWGDEDESNYDLHYTPGKLEITPADLRISLESVEKTYDGEYLIAWPTITCTEYPNYLDVVTANNSIVDAGSITPTVTIDYGGDSAADYNIVMDIGTLTILKRDLTITTYDAYKAYDGTPLTKNGYDIEGLVEGERVYVTVTGSQTEVGSSENTFDVEFDGHGGTYPSNYNLIKHMGTLEVGPAEPITTDSSFSTFSMLMPALDEPDEPDEPDNSVVPVKPDPATPTDLH